MSTGPYQPHWLFIGALHHQALRTYPSWISHHCHDAVTNHCEHSRTTKELPQDLTRTPCTLLHPLHDETFAERAETALRRLSTALERLEILVDALSVALISSAVSVRIGNLMELVLLSNAKKMIWNFACLVSACKIVGSRWWFLFTGVDSFGVESVVRTDWLLAMVETMTEGGGGCECHLRL